MRTCLPETNDHLFGISENQLESLNPKGNNPKAPDLTILRRRREKNPKKKKKVRTAQLWFEVWTLEEEALAGIVPLIIECSLMLYLLLPSELPVQGWHGVDYATSWLKFWHHILSPCAAWVNAKGKKTD